ncbi:hypothetical protein BJX76DRAFT_338222 [Aspergillus varians]
MHMNEGRSDAVFVHTGVYLQVAVTIAWIGPSPVSFASTAGRKSHLHSIISFYQTSRKSHCSIQWENWMWALGICI